MFEQFDVFAYRLRRKIRNLSVRRELIPPTAEYSGKIRLVISVDYEREFGHKQGELSSEVFHEILRILCEYGAKSTWNCVGHVAEKYPETIEHLIRDGHEIACHTFGHVAPLKISADDLRDDIRLAKELFRHKFGVELWGFRSPYGAWSPTLIGVLISLGFRYNIDRALNPSWQKLHWIKSARGKLGRGGRILRIPLVSTDGICIRKGMPPQEMLSQWLRFLEPEHLGECFTIGFHPWMLGKGKGRLAAFRSFVKIATSNPEVVVATGAEVAASFFQSPIIEKQK